jgi:hypothetical protein
MYACMCWVRRACHMPVEVFLLLWKWLRKGLEMVEKKKREMD